MALKREYTYLDERVISGTGLGTSPEAVRGILDLQQAAYQDNPADTAAAQQSADAAKGAADAAQMDASQGISDAATAKARADAAYDLADTKVTQDVGPPFPAPLAAPSRTAVPTYAGGTAGAVYTQSDVQGLMDQVAALTGIVAALVTDLRANHALRP